MNEKLERGFVRRDLFRFAIVGASSALIASDPALGKPVDLNDKRRPRYQADSPEVRNFYRVNGYPDR
jgi:hypothetical protein